MLTYKKDDNLICPHCHYKFDDACDDFLLCGVNREVGRVEQVECDICYELIDICDNGDGTISVCEG